MCSAMLGFGGGGVYFNICLEKVTFVNAEIG